MKLARYRPILVLFAWLWAAGVATDRAWDAHTAYSNRNEPNPRRHRADGNHGHAEVDFAGQWLMGRMLIQEHGRELYDRNQLWPIVREHFPRGQESPWVIEESFPLAIGTPESSELCPKYDAHRILEWLAGTDAPEWNQAGKSIATAIAAGGNGGWPTIAASIVGLESLDSKTVTSLNTPRRGGALYPPTHAFLMAPLALLPPQQAYQLWQLTLLILAILAGWLVSRLPSLSPWRDLACPLAIVFILIFPGTRAGLHLGQNCILSALLLIAGWVALQNQRPLLAGLFWGQLIYKPVWLAAFLIVPFFTAQSRWFLATIVTAFLLMIFTLPIVGLQAWFDWLAVGQIATATYQVNQNWIELSRDLFGLPARLLLDWNLPEDQRARPLAQMIGAGLFATLFFSTAWLAWRTSTNPQRTLLLATAAPLLGYRFMYYDVLLASFIPVVILTYPELWRQCRMSFALLLTLILYENYGKFHEFDLFITPRISIGFGPRYPVETILLLTIWCWHAIQSTRRPRS
ncbi:MAG: glycosyltransferase family 87 protein [Gemmataceae bacterium]